MSGMEAEPLKAKSANSGPGGCQSSASETVETTAAKRAPPTIIGHAGDGSVATSEPSPTATTITTAAVDCMTTRGSCTRLRP
ncbi:hypothetical protein [Agrococcus citreus]